MKLITIALVLYSGAAFAAEPVAREQIWIIDDYMVADSDGDGVKDSLDQCSGSIIGAIVDSKGCAKQVQSLRGYKRTYKTQFKAPELIAPAR